MKPVASITTRCLFFVVCEWVEEEAQIKWIADMRNILSEDGACNRRGVHEFEKRGQPMRATSTNDMTHSYIIHQ